jgi:hypothetical protein
MDWIFNSGWIIIQRKIVVYPEEFYEGKPFKGKT